jgi:hypothetical protein
MREFVESYLETAAWSSEEDGEDWSDAEWSDEAIARAERDCDTFLRCLDATGMDPEGHVAHDFWLTRCGHGAGFWDGDYPEPEASVLTTAATRFGEAWVTLGDDGLLYID